MIDVKLNDTWLSRSGWIRESIDFPTPQSQTKTIIVPGRNSPIRYNDFSGRISYEPRSFTIVLSMLGKREIFNRMVSDTVNKYAGRLCKVILSEEPGLYCTGTIECSPAYNPLSGKGQLTLSCSDGDAYRYYVDETVVRIQGSGRIVLANDFMPCVPTVKTTAETVLEWSLDDKSVSKTLSAGSFTIPELELCYGDNILSIESEGTTTFTYREGKL